MAVPNTDQLERLLRAKIIAENGGFYHTADALRLMEKAERLKLASLQASPSKFSLSIVSNLTV